MFDEIHLPLHPRNDDGSESEGGGTAGSGSDTGKLDRKVPPDRDSRG